MRTILLSLIFILLFSSILFAEDQNSAQGDFFDDFFDYNGPLLSMLLASLGLYSSIMITRLISSYLEIGSATMIKQPLLIATSLGIGIGAVLIGKIGLYAGWPPYIYYPIPLVISLVLPKFIFDLNWAEFGIYCLIAPAIGFLTHIIFSIFFDYHNYMPFLEIDPIWEWGKKENLSFNVPIFSFSI